MSGSTHGLLVVAHVRRGDVAGSGGDGIVATGFIRQAKKAIADKIDEILRNGKRQ